MAISGAPHRGASPVLFDMQQSCDVVAVPPFVIAIHVFTMQQMVDFHVDLDPKS